jgi:Flp pilus assembly protein TadD
MLACYQEVGFFSSQIFGMIFRRLLVASNMSADALCTLGIALAGSARHGEAANVFARSLILRPDDIDFYSNLGNALQERRWADRALPFYDRGLLIERTHARLITNRGRCLESLGWVRCGIDSYSSGISLDPMHFESVYNLGTSEMREGNFKLAVRQLRRAAILRPESELSQWNFALALLAVADFRAAWRRYDYRFSAKAVLRECQSRKPVFFGDRRDTRCLVWGEQGVGDEVMFGSMLGEFRGMVGKLLVQLDRRLIPLFRRSLPDDVEFFERGTVVPEDRYDSHIAIGSLGQYLRPTLESFAGKGGKYLWADPERIQAMREWLSVKEGERVIGLSWRSSNPETGAARSLALSDLVKSLQAPGVRFVNLQYGDVAAEIEALERDEGIEVLQCPGLDATDDLDGLAALIEACDEVVSIGNATAHLAGALGKKTTVLLPKAPSWRWLAEGEVSPWYREMSLCRNADMSPWADFLAATFVVRGRCR